MNTDAAGPASTRARGRQRPAVSDSGRAASSRLTDRAGADRRRSAGRARLSGACSTSPRAARTGRPGHQAAARRDGRSGRCRTTGSPATARAAARPSAAMARVATSGRSLRADVLVGIDRGRRTPDDLVALLVVQHLQEHAFAVRNRARRAQRLRVLQITRIALVVHRGAHRWHAGRALRRCAGSPGRDRATGCAAPVRPGRG